MSLENVLAKEVAFSHSIFSTQKYGGISRYFVELALSLKNEHGWRVQFDVPLNMNAYLRDMADEFDFHGRYIDRKFRWLGRLNGAINRIPGMKKSCAVEHLTYFEDSPRNRSTRARVCTFYDMINERYQHVDQVTKMKRSAYQTADRCIAISEQTKSDMVHFLNADPANIDVIYLASNMRPEAERLSHVPDCDYLLWVGPRQGYKNFEVLANAFATVKKEFDGLKIVCAGGPPPSQSEKEGWERLGFSVDSVIYCSPDERELASLYTHANCLVYASLFEGFGIPPLEAMRCGCPVLASDRGSIPEVTGDACLQFDPEDVDSLVHAIRVVLRDDNVQSGLREKGSVQADRFCWNRCAAETIEVYQNAAG